VKQLRVLPAETTGTPLPDSQAEQPPVIRRAEIVAFALISLLLICVAAVLYAAKAFFLPVVAAFVVGTMLSPAAGFLERHRIPRALAAVLIVSTVGAGVAFMEDAHIGEIWLSGDGWGAAKPWSLILPTISPLDSPGEFIALNNALWAALSGLTIGVAVMLRHWRWTWPIALVGPLLSITNHVMSNHYTTTEFGITAILDRGKDLPWIYDTIRDLTAAPDGGEQSAIPWIADP